MYNLPIEANLVSWISFQPIGVKLTSWILNWRINSSWPMRKRKRSRHRGLQLWRVFVWKSWLQFVNTFQKPMEIQLFFGSHREKDILAHCLNVIWGSLTKGMNSLILALNKVTHKIVRTNLNVIAEVTILPVAGQAQLRVKAWASITIIICLVSPIFLFYLPYFSDFAPFVFSISSISLCAFFCWAS